MRQTVRTKVKRKHRITQALMVLTGLAVLFASTSPVAAQQTADRDIYIPTTVSQQAQQALPAMQDNKF